MQIGVWRGIKAKCLILKYETELFHDTFEMFLSRWSGLLSRKLDLFSLLYPFHLLVCLSLSLILGTGIPLPSFLISNPYQYSTNWYLLNAAALGCEKGIYLIIWCLSDCPISGDFQTILPLFIGVEIFLHLQALNFFTLGNYFDSFSIHIILTPTENVLFCIVPLCGSGVPWWRGLIHWNVQALWKEYLWACEYLCQFVLGAGFR